MSGADQYSPVEFDNLYDELIGMGCVITNFDESSMSVVLNGIEIARALFVAPLANWCVSSNIDLPTIERQSDRHQCHNGCSDPVVPYCWPNDTTGVSHYFCTYCGDTVELY